MPETRFVQRDGDGNVVGHYALPQPGYAEEEVAADDADISAYETRLDEARSAAASGG